MKMKNGFIGHEVKFRGDFKEPREGESLAKRLSRMNREKQGIFGDTRGKKREMINQAKPKGFRYLLICPLVLKTFSLEEKL
jgi:hypothetical protein